jgi:ABC-type sulfate transport system permease component
MKKFLIATMIIVIFLIVLIPFASSNPDGLEKVVVTYGAQEHQSIWNGIMADYSFFSIGNQYVSTLIAGIFGVLAVLVAGLVLSKVMTPNNKSAKNNAHAHE